MPQADVQKKNITQVTTWVSSFAGLFISFVWPNALERKHACKHEKFHHHEKCNTGKTAQVSCSFRNIITPSDSEFWISENNKKKNIPRNWKSHLNLTKLMVIVHLILWESKGEMPPATPRNKDSLRGYEAHQCPLRIPQKKKRLAISWQVGIVWR